MRAFAITLLFWARLAAAVDPRTEMCKGAMNVPDEIVDELKTVLRESEHARNRVFRGTLEVSAATALPDGSALLFVQVPDYAEGSNTVVPVRVNAAGQWTSGTPMPGRITGLVRDRDGTLYAVTQWQVEGTYPSLFRSRDGLAWTEWSLPPGATAGPQRALTHLCATGGLVRVALTDANGKKRRDLSWMSDDRGAAWRRAPEPTGACRLVERTPQAMTCADPTMQAYRIGGRLLAMPRALD